MANPSGDIHMPPLTSILLPASLVEVGMVAFI
jgi:hypothetical protein